MNVLALNGSASADSSNLHLLKLVAGIIPDSANYDVYDDLQSLPLFNADQALGVLPKPVQDIHWKIRNSDLIIISTPEYIFSVPAGLKNLLEWCVSTSVFSGKRLALVVASAHGEACFHLLKHILRTIEAILPDEHCLLIQGIRGKMSSAGEFIDAATQVTFENWIRNVITNTRI